MGVLRRTLCTVCENLRTAHFYNSALTSPYPKIFWAQIRYFRFSARNSSLWTIEYDRSDAKPFPVLNGTIEKCEHFEKNKQSYMKKEQEYEKILEVSLKGGGAKAIERHTVKQKKMLVSDRIRSLLDNGSQFLELSPIGGMGMRYGDVPRTGNVTGIGKVHNKYCMIIANDATVKGGSIYPITLKKNLRAQEIAKQNRLPCVYVVESGGAFLPLQSELFNPGGQTFYNEAVMSAGKIPQVAIVCGSCTAGGAYIPTMADDAVIVNKNGTIFLAGPPLVKAALGEVISADELGGASLHCRTSGCTDYFARNEKEAFEMGRDIVSSLNIEDRSSIARTMDVEEPVYDINDVHGLIPCQSQQELNIYQVIARIVDGSRFHEFKQLYGDNLVCGYSYVNGYLVGILGNQGIISEKAALKGCHFVFMCCERNIPLVFLQNTSGAEDDVLDGNELGCRLKAQGKLMAAVSCAMVPKITIRIGDGYGPEQYMMGGKCMSPNFIFSWPNSTVGVKDPVRLAEDLIQSSTTDMSAEEKSKILNDTINKLTNEMSAIYASAHLQDDGIIKPVDTRKVLSECLQIVHAYQTYPKTDYPVFKM